MVDSPSSSEAMSFSCPHKCSNDAADASISVFFRPPNAQVWASQGWAWGMAVPGQLHERKVAKGVREARPIHRQ